MIYLHCKFCNLIKINYGGPDTGHVRAAGRSLETPGLEDKKKTILTKVLLTSIGCNRYQLKISVSWALTCAILNLLYEQRCVIIR
jgi:hypothetical protein